MQPKTKAAAGKEKSPTALKTIGEAAEILNVPQHVLRFWETKFPQIKPLKRNGGRRFYRPQDIEALLLIRHLLYQQGYTIEGARKAFDRDIIHQFQSSFSAVAKGQPTEQHNDNDSVAASSAGAQTETAKQVADELRDLSAQLRQELAKHHRS